MSIIIGFLTYHRRQRHSEIVGNLPSLLCAHFHVSVSGFTLRWLKSLELTKTFLVKKQV